MEDGAYKRIDNAFLIKCPPSETQKQDMKALADVVAQKIVDANGIGFSMAHFVMELEKSLMDKSSVTQKILISQGHKLWLSNCYTNWIHDGTLSNEQQPSVERDIFRTKYDKRTVGENMEEFGARILKVENGGECLKHPKEKCIEVGLANVSDKKDTKGEIVELSQYNEWRINESLNGYERVDILYKCSCCK